MRRSTRVGLVAAVVLGAAGCGSGPYPVSGQVVYDDGKPVAELTGWAIVFDSQELRVSSVGTVGPDGRFDLNYRKARDGAMPGTYKVTIYNPNQDAPDEGDANAGRAPKKKSKRPLAAKYADLAQTPLTATVEAKTNDITLKVERP